ncbi:MAG: hypothetical protein IPP30_07575 [Flavobacterium sp.]|nr:hypothetical protein [Flavobacterium sp.]
MTKEIIAMGTSNQQEILIFGSSEEEDTKSKEKHKMYDSPIHNVTTDIG